MKTGKPVKDILLSSHLMDQKEVSAVLDPKRMTKPGIKGLGKLREMRSERIGNLRKNAHRKHSKTEE